MTFEIARADALAWLRELPTESVDLIFTDPAYESLERHRAIGSAKCRRLTDWFPIFRNELFPDFFEQCYRVLKRDRHCYLMCDAETMFVVRPMAEAAGFRFWKPVVWHKLGSLGMGYHYRNCYEFILFFEKGKRKLNDLGVGDVLPVKKIVKGYPTEKPVELITTFIRESTQPGEVVIDPFMGSGSTGVAALQLGREFMGCDCQESAVELTRQRLAVAGGQHAQETAT